jgi:hypothetical protein
VALGGANQFRIFTSEEKRIDEWKYSVIVAAREWFYQHKTDDEAYNKQLMTRIIREDKQARAQSAVVSYFIKKKMWDIVKKGVKWYDVQTDLQWTIYLDCYRAAVTDPRNPNLPMLDRLMAAMSRIPDVGEEVEVLGTASEKGLLDLAWDDYIIQVKKAVPERALVCATCGKTGHVSATCYNRQHPDANHAHTTWKESVPGKAWAARGFTTLPADRTLRGGPAAPRRGENRGEMIPLCISCNNLRASIPIDKDILMLKININNNVIMCRTLLDTGSIQATFVNMRTAEALGAAGIQAGTNGRVRVCGAVGGCAFSGSNIVFPLSINNEITGGEEVVMLSAMVLNTPDYDIIIGKPM